MSFRLNYDTLSRFCIESPRGDSFTFFLSELPVHVNKKEREN